MRKFWFCFVSGATTAITIYILWIASTHGQSDGADVVFMKKLMDMKTEASETIEGERMVLASGSGFLFGIRSKVMEDVISMPVVNLSLHGGLGPAYISHFVKGLIRRNDNLLLAFEYPLLTGDSVVNDTAVFLSWARGDGYWKTLGLRHKIDFFRLFTLKRLMALSMNSSREGQEGSLGPWRVSMISPRGDLVVPDRIADTIGNELRKNFDRDSENLLSRGREFVLDLDSENVSAVIQLVDEAKRIGARVYATWPAVADRNLYHVAYHRLVSELPEFYQSIGVEFVTTQNQGYVPETHLLDTAFHLNESGSRVWTRALGKALCEQTPICESN